LNYDYPAKMPSFFDEFKVKPEFFPSIVEFGFRFPDYPAKPKRKPRWMR
jgi:hypothetical protein